jgi:hypothetical protein
MATRDESGRFLPGNPGGPGNPHAKRVAELRTKALDAATPDDIESIMSKQVELAKKGDRKAAEFVFKWLFGVKARLDVNVSVDAQLRVWQEKLQIMLGSETVAAELDRLGLVREPE